MTIRFVIPTGSGISENWGAEAGFGGTIGAIVESGGGRAGGGDVSGAGALKPSRVGRDAGGFSR